MTYPELENDYAELISSDFFGFDCGEGWITLVSSFIKSLKIFCATNNVTDIELTQLKSKFGTLRIHLSAHECLNYELEKELKELLYKYECMSYYVCERCGKDKHDKITKHGGWLYNLCNMCLDVLKIGDK